MALVSGSTVAVAAMFPVAFARRTGSSRIWRAASESVLIVTTPSGPIDSCAAAVKQSRQTSDIRTKPKATRAAFPWHLDDSRIILIDLIDTFRRHRPMTVAGKRQ
jgi:hypothetical protein